MANDKDKESVVPGDGPPTNADGTLKVDAAAKKATAKNEEAARSGEANTGLSATTNPTPLPAGEMRPSIDVPTLLPPAPDAPPDFSKAPATGKVAEDLLEIEQDLAWLIQHQPSQLIQQVPEIRALYAKVQAERYQEKPSADLVDLAKRKLATLGVAPEALPSGQRKK